jgi:hypothetical protein
MNISWDIVSIIISLLSLGVVIYKEFIQGPKLHSSVSQVILIRLPESNKASLSQDILLDDLLSDRPSRRSEVIKHLSPEIENSIQGRNRDKLLGILLDLNQKRSINYSPPTDLIRRYWGDKRYAVSFLIPLVIYNSGRKFAYVNSLVLIAHSKNQPDKRWAFSVFVELDRRKLLDREPKQKDEERLSDFFAGFAVGPGESVQVNPWFTLIHDTNDQIISHESMMPGEYLLQVFGYDSRGKKVLSTESVEYTLLEKNLFDMFRGTESVKHTRMDESIIEAAVK